MNKVYVDLLYRPPNQRIFDAHLSVDPTELALKPAIPDPLKMPYPEMQERDPYPSPRVRFEPAYLDFGQVHIGEESVKKVTIFNLSHDESILINVSTPCLKDMQSLGKFRAFPFLDYF